MKKKYQKISKKLSYWLRHKPESLGITIEDNGWTDLNIFLNKSGIALSDIEKVVEINDKKRFSLNANKTKIRANQGHSIKGLKFDFERVKNPPKYLFHGMPLNVENLIKKQGLKKMNRHHVHLSIDEDTAAKVGQRRGKYKIIKIKAKLMAFDGYSIYISENGVYLTDYVPVKYIEF